MPTIVEKGMAEDIEWGTGDTSKTHPSGGVLPGTQVSLSSLSTVSPNGYAATQAWDDLASVDAGSYTTKDVTVVGAELGDFVSVSFSLSLQNPSDSTQYLTLDAQVSATNTVTCVLVNPTGSAIDLGTTGTLKVLVFKVR